MSWFKTGEFDTSNEDWRNEVHAIEVPHNNDPTAEASQDQQVRWAAETLEDAIDCGVVGKEGHKFSYQISGHANPDHEPREGWANEVVTVSIARKG